MGSLLDLGYAWGVCGQILKNEVFAHDLEGSLDTWRKHSPDIWCILKFSSKWPKTIKFVWTAITHLNKEMESCVRFQTFLILTGEKCWWTKEFCSSYWDWALQVSEWSKFKATLRSGDFTIFFITERHKIICGSFL